MLPMVLRDGELSRCWGISRTGRPSIAAKWLGKAHIRNHRDLSYLPRFAKPVLLPPLERFVMEVRLKVLIGKNAGQIIRVAGPKFVIGRADDCHLRPRSDLISRQHCALVIEGEYAAIRDFGSKNGTQVNGRRVEGELELADGDELCAGPLRFEVQLIGVRKPKPISSGSSDEDISDWLSDSTVMDGSTRSLPDQETIEMMMAVSQTAEISGEVKDPAATEKDKSDGKSAKKKEPGKLPPLPKTMSESSETAAADMLRRLRNLR